MSAIDETLPTEVRLSLYLSMRLLQELQLALQLIGMPSTYVRPGIEGVAFPRLYVGSTRDEPRAICEVDAVAEPADEPPDKAEDAIVVLDYFICAVPLPLHGQQHSRLVPAVEWWFMWWGEELLPICVARDMRYAARVVVDYEGPA